MTQEQLQNNNTQENTGVNNTASTAVENTTPNAGDIDNSQVTESTPVNEWEIKAKEYESILEAKRQEEAELKYGYKQALQQLEQYKNLTPQQQTQVNNAVDNQSNAQKVNFWTDPETAIDSIIENRFKQSQQDSIQAQQDSYIRSENLKVAEAQVKDLQEYMLNGKKITSEQAESMIDDLYGRFQRRTGKEFLQDQADYEFFTQSIVKEYIKNLGLVKLIPPKEEVQLSNAVIQSQSGFNSQVATPLNASDVIARIESELKEAQKQALQNPSLENRMKVSKLSMEKQSLQKNNRS